MKPGDEQDPPPELDPKARRALFWIYLAMAAGVILPPVLFFLFGVTSE